VDKVGKVIWTCENVFVDISRDMDSGAWWYKIGVSSLNVVVGSTTATRK